METIYSFEPIADANAKALILGSMPSELSLKSAQYYAYPRNSFWMIMDTLFGANPSLPYTKRTQILLSKSLALWDVLKACKRKGSLDANIDNSSIIVNDFASFYAQHPKLKFVFFNGTKAESVYKKYVFSTIISHFPTIQYMRLPSTSPANASLSREEKLAKWHVVKTAVEQLQPTV
ncbi:g:t/u mismatch-specific DNA glycosylase [Candidatus Thiomargarita nelsonii]|uniref:G:t/u mismatch-specific DNA glycosylase n=1 Tax=Candidatus Thiomargarita nelsonii TaxID=1003181 RepID=A0A0A6P0U9_9GAMM|nr:g:t/u mismatch-specific DNA glycosylase [Candidatus Thiomargarita nelsonii]